MKRVLRTLSWATLSLLSLLALALVVIRAGTPAPPKPPETTGRLFHAGMEWERRARTWLTYRPKQPRDPAALVVALPGSGQTGETLRLATNFGFEALADRDGFLLVYAEAWSEGSAIGPEWNDCRKNTSQPAHIENVDDVGFVLEVLAATAREYRVDTARVYVVGVSDGGQMAYRLAAEHPDRFAAIAAIVAQEPVPENSSCRMPRGPISVLVMNGTDDPVIPYEGGEASFFGWLSAGELRSTEETIASWKAVNGIDAPGTREQLPDRDGEDGSIVVRERWQAASGFEVILYSIIGGGHSIPGGYRGAPDFLLGATNRDIDAMAEIWTFFRRHDRSTARVGEDVEPSPTRSPRLLNR